VVDDETDVRNLTKMHLENAGFTVILASSGEEALQKADSEAPNLILMDVVMPGKSGFEICKILKSQQKTKAIPVVIFTVLGREADFRMSIEAGADMFLSKPMRSQDLDNLVDAVKKLLQKVKPSAH
jgi:DNA-binding response OmpR family regulator